MANDRCPWCGASVRSVTAKGTRIFHCESAVYYDGDKEQSEECKAGQTVAQLEARIAALESTLQTILETVADLIDVLKRMNGGG